MKLTIVGTGYVGLVTGACFAEMGNQVTCVDIDEEKLEGLRQGIVPIHEPGLEDLIARNAAYGRIVFTSDLEESLIDTPLVFIAVGTPPNEDGSADLSHVLAVARDIGEYIRAPLVVVDKSTVPVGTADRVKETIAEALAGRGETIEFDVVSNPEFLKEGAAIDDFMSPDRIVIGYEKASSRALLHELYAPFSRNHDKIQYMGVRDAEMTKYAANAMLATRISFMNEIALMCDHFGVDVENVRKGIGSDPRIGYSFIYPGAGYGGSCFPKDVRALVNMAESAGLDARMFQAVEDRNRLQKVVLMERIKERFGDDLSDRTFTLWGLAFKPETDDVREAPALAMIEALVASGATVNAFDPKAMATAGQQLPESCKASVNFLSDPYESIHMSDALIIMTEWKMFRLPDFIRLRDLGEKIIFDGRNMYDPLAVVNHGLEYVGIGRSSELLH